MRNTIAVWIISSLCISSLLLPVDAEIYKYKDKNGRWQFTDKPVNSDGTPLKKNTTTKNSASTSSSKQTGKTDLKEALFSRFNPTSKVDEATLSVVTIETSVGSGSGFFITDNGYLVTNRHVIRPSTSTGWKDREEKLKEFKIELDNFKELLDEDKEELKSLKKDIDEDQLYIDTNKVSKRSKQNHKRNIEFYKKTKQKYKSNKARYRKKEREYNHQYSELGFSSSMSNFSKKFTIILKNNKKYKAKLIKVSKNHDLALLKLDNYTTPFLKLSKNQPPRQGTEVFAIGSPLGVTDSLTTGIIAKSGNDHIYTDAQILPGNSGGPLVNAKGIVLGVNTAVLSQTRNADGLGLALYSKLIKDEFRGKLPGGL